MHQETLEQIVSELESLLPGRFLGRLFQLSPVSFAIDFGLKDRLFLFISIEPSAPRLHLVKRSVRQLEKASQPLLAFGQAVRSVLNGAKLTSLAKDENERIVRLHFQTSNDLGSEGYALVAQLTGRSANLFLLDSAVYIIHACRTPQGKGQQIGELYQPPKQQTGRAQNPASDVLLLSGPESSISEVVDAHYRRLALDAEFDSRARAMQAKLRREIAKRKKLTTNLQKDLADHGEPEPHKRLGDLLLANIATAKRHGNSVKVTDYYASDAPTIEIEVDENMSLQEAAGQYFSRYTKAKRAVEEIGARLSQVREELEEFDRRQNQLEDAIANRDLSAFSQLDPQKAKPPGGARKKDKAALTLPGLRRYVSTDGYEVLVGRTARDNDKLTFRVARPHDLWLHAGDYPGSHVIVRNSSRKEIPHRTIIEAAQLAAKFSQASKDSKVSIHYTQRKFLTKPKGAASGLVRLSTFKTITVEPGENLERIKD